MQNYVVNIIIPNILQDYLQFLPLVNETCKEVNRKYDWDLSTVKKFRLNIDNLMRVIKVTWKSFR